MTSPAVSPSVADTARPRIVYLYLAIVAGSFAGNWPVMKLALADAPGPVFVLLRLMGTLAIMAPLMVVLRAPAVPRRGERLGQSVVGLFQIGGVLNITRLRPSVLPAG